MTRSIESALRRRMLATVVLFVACAISFVGALAVLYGYVVPTMLAWWAQRFDMSSEIGLVAVLVPASVVLWLAVGTVRNFYASPLSATNAKAASEADYPRLHASLRRLAQQADVPVPSLKILPSRVPNAFTVGLTPSTSTVVVSTGLLETLDEDELYAVLAHELAHVTNRDGAVMSVGYLLPAIAFAFATALTSPFERDDGPEWDDDGDGGTDDVRLGPNGNRRHSTWSNVPVPLFGSNSSSSTTTSSGSWGGSSSDGGGDDGGGGIIVAILVLVAILVITAICTLAISTFFWAFSSLTLLLLARTREYAADWGAVELTGDPEALASALSKLDDEMAKVPVRDLRQVDGAVETLYVMPLRRGMYGLSDVVLLSDDFFPRTHPDTEKRIERIFEAAADA